MKQLLLTLTALLACVSFASAEINTFTGYGQGTAWESYTDQQQKAGFLPGVKHKRVTLTAANMIAMYTTPVVLLAAPGTGKVITINRFSSRSPELQPHSQAAARPSFNTTARLTAGALMPAIQPLLQRLSQGHQARVIARETAQSSPIAPRLRTRASTSATQPQSLPQAPEQPW
jgi:hypothetical protein